MHVIIYQRKGNWIIYLTVPTKTQLNKNQSCHLQLYHLFCTNEKVKFSLTCFSLWTNIFPRFILSHVFYFQGNYIQFCFIWAIVCEIPSIHTGFMREISTRPMRPLHVPFLPSFLVWASCTGKQFSKYLVLLHLTPKKALKAIWHANMVRRSILSANRCQAVKFQECQFWFCWFGGVFTLFNCQNHKLIQIYLRLLIFHPFQNLRTWKN